MRVSEVVREEATGDVVREEATGDVVRRASSSKPCVERPHIHWQTSNRVGPFSQWYHLWYC